MDCSEITSTSYSTGELCVFKYVHMFIYVLTLHAILYEGKCNESGNFKNRDSWYSGKFWIVEYLFHFSCQQGYAI